MSQSGSRSLARVRSNTAAIALLSALTPSPAAADDKNALLNRTLLVAEQKLRTCGAELHARFGVEPGSLRAITYAVAPDVHACRDLNTVALAKVGEPLIVLCTPQFWRKAEQAPEDAAYFLIHEYLHTRGLGEWPNGGKYDSVSITQTVKQVCQE